MLLTIQAKSVYFIVMITGYFTLHLWPWTTLSTVDAAIDAIQVLSTDWMWGVIATGLIAATDCLLHEYGQVQTVDWFYV